MARKIRLWGEFLKFTFIGLISTFLSTIGCSKNNFSPDINKNKTNDLPSDPHWLPVEGDSDNDYMSDEEEIGANYDPLDPDMNSNMLIDGPELAQFYFNVIENLPWKEGEEPNQVYREAFPTFGIENCEVCGAEENMGFVRIRNPHTGDYIDIPFIALHYLSHGSFSYDGTEHDGRIDFNHLGEVLRDAHLFQIDNDRDEDFLSDLEEIAIGTPPQNPDVNGNWVKDGIDLAYETFSIIDNLPQGPLPDEVYRIEHLTYGIEVCSVCGEMVNMGFVQIVNPQMGLEINLPYIALHYMEHGGYSYTGDVHEGRVNVYLLRKVLGLVYQGGLKQAREK